MDSQDCVQIPCCWLSQVFQLNNAGFEKVWFWKLDLRLVHYILTSFASCSGAYLACGASAWERNCNLAPIEGQLNWICLNCIVKFSTVILTVETSLVLLIISWHGFTKASYIFRVIVLCGSTIWSLFCIIGLFHDLLWLRLLLFNVEDLSLQSSTAGPNRKPFWAKACASSSA